MTQFPEETSKKMQQFRLLKWGKFGGNPCSLSFHLAVFLFWDPETSFFLEKKVKHVHSIHESFTKSKMSTSDTGNTSLFCSTSLCFPRGAASLTSMKTLRIRFANNPTQKIFGRCEPPSPRCDPLLGSFRDEERDHRSFARHEKNSPVDHIYTFIFKMS